MEATLTDTTRAEARLRSTPWETAKSCCLAVAGALAEGARDDSLDRLLTTSASASFSALPRSQQNRLLDRGFQCPR